MPTSIAKCAMTKMIPATMALRITDWGRTECDWGAVFTDDVALAHGLNGIAAKLSVGATDFYVHRIERISIPPSLTDGLVRRCL